MSTQLTDSREQSDTRLVMCLRNDGFAVYLSVGKVLHNSLSICLAVRHQSAPAGIDSESSYASFSSSKIDTFAGVSLVVFLRAN